MLSPFVTSIVEDRGVHRSLVDDISKARQLYYQKLCIIEAAGYFMSC